MRIPRPAQLVLSVVLSAGITITAIGPGASAPPGDPAAKAAIVAAFQRLNALPSFRMRSTSIEDGGKVVVEFVRPDKIHVTLQSPQYSYESIAVGKQSASRTTAPNEPPGWRCTPGTLPVAGDFFNIDGIRRDLEVAPAVRKPDTVIDGTPVHAYGDSSGKTTLYVGVKTGLPRRFVDTNQDTGKTNSADFYDYGAPIAIAMPPCK